MCMFELETIEKSKLRGWNTNRWFSFSFCAVRYFAMHRRTAERNLFVGIWIAQNYSTMFSLELKISSSYPSKRSTRLFVGLDEFPANNKYDKIDHLQNIIFTA
jgi:hypothetical protein